MTANPYQLITVAGNGTIATGLAAFASAGSDVLVLTRSEEAAERAAAGLDRACARAEGADRDRIRVTTRIEEAAAADLVAEAVVEDLAVKADLLGRLAAAGSADLASTTSSLLIADIADRCGAPDRLFGLHVFNPVPVMKLVELCLPDRLADGIADRARAWCEATGKVAVEVEDTTGFAVNRLLFPYLFDAVRYHERTGMEPADVDTCMTLGVAHPMGPLALLDLVGLDVAVAIGEALHAESGDREHLAPTAVTGLVEAGHLGRKTGRGFYSYD